MSPDSVFGDLLPVATKPFLTLSPRTGEWRWAVPKEEVPRGLLREMVDWLGFVAGDRGVPGPERAVVKDVLVDKSGLFRGPARLLIVLCSWL